MARWNSGRRAGEQQSVGRELKAERSESRVGPSHVEGERRALLMWRHVDSPAPPTAGGQGGSGDLACSSPAHTPTRPPTACDRPAKAHYEHDRRLGDGSPIRSLARPQEVTERRWREIVTCAECRSARPLCLPSAQSGARFCWGRRGQMGQRRRRGGSDADGGWTRAISGTRHEHPAETSGTAHQVSQVRTSQHKSGRWHRPERERDTAFVV
jgi:hypothetical protein